MRFASLSSDIWELESGVARNREAPDTFSIPIEEARRTLNPGDLVKLMFHIRPNSEIDEIERMWVVVTHIIGDQYLGRLDNEPDCLSDASDASLKAGAEIPFGPEHVIAIHDDPLSREELESVMKTPSTAPWPRYDA